MRVHRGSAATFATLRKRMIAETELALVIGLRFPERMPRIPTVRAGEDTFPAELAAQFWAEALGIDVAQALARETSPDIPRLTA